MEYTGIAQAFALTWLHSSSQAWYWNQSSNNWCWNVSKKVHLWVMSEYECMVRKREMEYECTARPYQIERESSAISELGRKPV